MWRVLQLALVPFRTIHANQDNIFFWLIILDTVLSWSRELLPLLYNLLKRTREKSEEEGEAMASDDEEMDTVLEMETREKWYADPPSSTKPLIGQAKYLFCAMQTECEPCKDKQHCGSLMREMQYEHAKYEKLPDIKYNFLIGGDGRVYEGRGWNVRPTLPQRYSDLSDQSYYIGFIGDLTEEPSEIMLESRDLLMTHMLNSHKLNSKFLHFMLTRLDLKFVMRPKDDT
uniref:Peptidoglycan recognition protein 10 n=1 Tax=Nephotettix cincticeps TaxID=94400 RepID=A0A5H2X4K0_NEPCI|nr:peptidoglycan recognition protein 10 [Nephotettix cincticeps]